MELLLRFVLGGAIVGVFAIIGDILTPESFGGLFAAAPSVALATLSLTVWKQGSAVASTECRSMMAGAVALAVYSCVVGWLLERRRWSPIMATTFAMAPWFGVAFGLWYAFLE